MINIRNVTMKPSGRREGQRGGRRGRKGMRNKQKGDRKYKWEGAVSIEKKTIHLRVQMKKAGGVKATDRSIDRLIEKDEKGRARGGSVRGGF